MDFRRVQLLLDNAEHRIHLLVLVLEVCFSFFVLLGFVQVGARRGHLVPQPLQLLLISALVEFSLYLGYLGEVFRLNLFVVVRLTATLLNFDQASVAVRFFDSAQAASGQLLLLLRL